MAQGLKFSDVDRYQLKCSFLQVIEELNSKQAANQHLEEKITILMKEKYDLERKIDNLVSEKKQEDLEHQKNLSVIKRDYECQVLELNNSHREDQICRKVLEEEASSLKEKIRDLELHNYNQGQHIQAFERRLEYQTDLHKQQEQQMFSIEGKVQTVAAQCQQVQEYQKRLEISELDQGGEGRIRIIDFPKYFELLQDIWGPFQ